MGRLHTCYSPVRRSPAGRTSPPPAAPRLACVKPVASVHPEPGSNSSLLFIFYFLFFNKNAKDKYQFVVLPSQNRLRSIRLTLTYLVSELTRVFLTLVLLLSIVNLSMFSGRFLFLVENFAKLRTIFDLTKFLSVFLCFLTVIQTSVRKASAKLRTFIVTTKFFTLFLKKNQTLLHNIL